MGIGIGLETRLWSLERVPSGLTVEFGTGGQSERARMSEAPLFGSMVLIRSL